MAGRIMTKFPARFRQTTDTARPLLNYDVRVICV